MQNEVVPPNLISDGGWPRSKADVEGIPPNQGFSNPPLGLTQIHPIERALGPIPIVCFLISIFFVMKFQIFGTEGAKILINKCFKEKLADFWRFGQILIKLIILN